MKRVDEIEVRSVVPPVAEDDTAWLIARVRRLEAALDAARVHVPAGEPLAGWEYRVPGRDAVAHNAAIDAALAEDP